MEKQYANFLNGHSPDDELVKLALEDVQKSGLFPETLEVAGVRIFSGNKDQLKNRLGFAFINGENLLNVCRLIEIPYFSKDSKILFYRSKLIPSIADKQGKEIKYLHPLSKPAIPYILPEVWKVQDKANKPIWITEGEKKALALIQHGRHAIALSGVWNFRAGAKSDLDSDKSLWAEIECFAARGRNIFMAFDSDLWTNPLVRRALYELSFKLYDKGANIRIVTWGNNDKGIDDFLVRENNPKALQVLEVVAASLMEFMCPDHRSEIIPALSFVRDEIEKELLAKAFAKKLKISPKFIRQAVGEEDEPIVSANFPGLIDLVSENSEAEGTEGSGTAYLIKDGENLLIETKYVVNGLKHIPPQQVPWLLVSGELVLNHYQKLKNDPAVALFELYIDVVNYFKSISDLPHDGYYHLLAIWVFHTYLTEPCQYSPIISFYAIAERGKTRTGKGKIYIGRRGLHVQTLREAYILRACHDMKATLFFDVMDLWKKAEQNGTEDIILSKFEKGLTVPRVNNPDRGPHRDTTYYNVFGPTVIATNECVHRILETRALQINMPEGTKIYDVDVTPEQAVELKGRLLAFRAYFIDKALPNVSKPVSGRLGDITRPLLQIARIVNPQVEETLIKLINELNQQRMLEKSETIEAMIIKVICSLENEVVAGKLGIGDITAKYNLGKSEKYHSSKTSIGRRLSAMGFEKVRLNDGSMAIHYDEGKISKLKDKYGLGKPPEPSEPSKPESSLNAKSEASESSEGFFRGVRDGIFEMEIEL